MSEIGEENEHFKNLEYWNDDGEEFYSSDYFQECGVPPFGCIWNLNLGCEDLDSRVILSDACSWEVVGLGVRQESFAHAGFQGTVEGLLSKVRRDVDMMRDAYEPHVQVDIDVFLARIDDTLEGKLLESDCCRLFLRDAAGLSRLMNFTDDSDRATRELFTRSYQDKDALGLFPEELPVMCEEDQFTTPEAVAALIGNARNVVCFSGAGISVESGIPPFRSTGAINPSNKGDDEATKTQRKTDSTNGTIWGEFDASRMTLQGFNGSEEVTAAWWDMKHSLLPKFHKAHPNDAHHFFGFLEQRGQLRGVVTQNIDSLHQQGGVPVDKVIELHGHMRGLICANNGSSIFNPVPIGDGSCTYALSDEEAKAVDYFSEATIPRCPHCTSPLRTETVMFNQPLPTGFFDSSIDMAATADVFIVIGSSLVVAPANDLPKVALRNGAALVMVNLDDTQYDENATALVRAPAGSFFAKVRNILEARDAS